MDGNVYVKKGTIWSMENVGNVKVMKFTSRLIKNVSVSVDFYKFLTGLNAFVFKITNLWEESVWSAVIINFMTDLL